MPTATRVLIGDFGAIARQGFRETLAEEGFEVLDVDCSPAEVLPNLRAHHPDIVLLDLDLSGTEELATELTHRFPNTRVLACSAERPHMRIYPKDGAAPYSAELDAAGLAQAVRG